MAFDGIVLQGQALKIRRPKDYAPIPGISGELALQLEHIHKGTCKLKMATCHVFETTPTFKFNPVQSSPSICALG